MRHFPDASAAVAESFPLAIAPRQSRCLASSINGALWYHETSGVGRQQPAKLGRATGPTSSMTSADAEPDQNGLGFNLVGIALRPLPA